MRQMRQPDFPDSLKALRRYPEFRALIAKHGPPELARYHGKRTIFGSLLRSIIYQQLSGKAAAAIHGRVLALFPAANPTPEVLATIRTEELRAAGLSASKVVYVRDLARAFSDGSINERALRRKSSDEIIETLTAIKGVGVWTVQMLLIFTLYRPDILPTDDLGIRKGFKKVFKLRELPTRKEMEKIAAPWRAHATAASWYLWRSLEE